MDSGTMPKDDRMEEVRNIALIDLGTVSSRLSLAQVSGGTVIRARKHTEITDLGEGVDATGRLSTGALDRVEAACRAFVEEARGFGAECTCTTLTSAARDAENSADLLGRLRALGLAPQIIPGEVEARLTFYGVAHDFAGERIAVADSGGGSTELAVGAYLPGEGGVVLEHVRSLDIGCRRVTDRFLHGDPATSDEMASAASWSASLLGAYWGSFDERPDRLVAVGGTVTTILSMVLGLDPYDSKIVHLHELRRGDVEGWLRSTSPLTVAEIARIKGIQAKRAPVIRAGAIIIDELMRAGGYEKLTVSENSLLAGGAATVGEVLSGQETAIGWTPELAML